MMSAEPFLDVNMSLPVVLAGASIVVFSFLGFDTMTTLSEETIQPKKTIPKAIFIMIGIVAFLHVGTSYFIQTALPNLSFVDPDSAALELVGNCRRELSTFDFYNRVNCGHFHARVGICNECFQAAICDGAGFDPSQEMVWIPAPYI